MKTILILFTSLFFTLSFAQIGGNQLYGNTDYSNSYQKNNSVSLANLKPKILTNENSITLDISILNHVQADYYMVTFGVNEENLSVELCNTQINKRIENFIRSIEKLGIKKSEVYVDFISQTKIYDHISEAEGEKVNIQQVDVGFEIKKNIIFKLKNIELFDQLVELASKQKIYNIINVEYYADNQDKIYDEMLVEAISIQKKRIKHLNLNEKEWDLVPEFTISFSSVQPGNQYKSYRAYESGTISYNNYYNNNTLVVQKEERKSRTFYFDGLPTDGFDKVMNASSPIVGLQYVMNVQIVYKKHKEDNSDKIYHLITPNGELKEIRLE